MMTVRTRHPRRHVAFLLACSLAVGLFAPGVAFAFDERIAGRPITESHALAEATPSVTIPAGILMTSDGTVLWERDADAERAMASTTKIMTALVAIETADLTDVATISLQASLVGESSIPVNAGDTFTVAELVDATLVHSANNAAFALAEHVGGNVLRFVELMNDRAEALGLTHTHYTNPHGLDEDRHYTSARDLATLARAAMANERFRAVAGLDTVSIKGKAYDNTNELIGRYDGATGIKTGFTDDAGYCLVASAERDGVSLIAVVLGAESMRERFTQAETLLDWGFEHYRRTRLVSADTTAALVPVSEYLDRTVAAIVPADVSTVLFDLSGPVTTRLEVLQRVDAPVAAGDTLGTLTVMQGDTTIAEVPVVAAAAVEDPLILESVKTWFVRLWRGVFGGTLRAAPVTMM